MSKKNNYREESLKIPLSGVFVPLKRNFYFDGSKKTKTKKARICDCTLIENSLKIYIALTD
jgi:hypothetical protein